MLSSISISEDFKDIDILNAMNLESFPKAERLEFFEMIKMNKHDEVDFMAIYDKELFIGFYLIFKKYSCVYIYFLAIRKEFRNLSYGTKLLAFLNEKYKDYQILLDIEEIDDKADNNTQRISRKKFYMRNSYNETQYRMQYVGMRFELLFAGNKIKIDNFKKLVYKTSEIINKYSTNKFEPIIFNV